MKKLNNPAPNNKPNYSSKTIVMKNLNFLSKLAGIILLLAVTVQNAAAGKPQTPYQQLQIILNENGIEKYAVTDELTSREIEYISSDVAIQFKVPESVVNSATTIGEMLTNILKYQYAGKKGKEWEWKKIQYSSNPDDYDWFMFSHPESKHGVEAMSKYMVTRLHEIFISLAEAEADSIDEICEDFLSWYLKYSYYYEHYIRKYDCGGCGMQCIDYEGFSYINPEEWAEVIREYFHDKAEEQQAWKTVVRENTHDAYWNFLMEYPQSTSVDTALERIRRFEQPAWNKALELNNREAYEAFVKQFPQGIYSLEAYRKIVHSHVDTTATEAVENSLMELCYFERPGYSLVGIGNVNREEKRYTVTFSGDLGYRLEIEPGEIKWLEVLNGDYVVLVEAEGGEPWWGNVSCYNHLYAAAWYVKKVYQNPLHINLHHPMNLKANPFLSVSYESPYTSFATEDETDIDHEAAERFVKAIEEQCIDEE